MTYPQIEMGTTEVLVITGPRDAFTVPIEEWEALTAPELVQWIEGHHRALDHAGRLFAHQTTLGPRSTCCGAEIHVTRIVRDVAGYDPVEAYLSDGDIMVLEVRYSSVIEGLDSETGYVATCVSCSSELDVTVEEVWR